MQRLPQSVVAIAGVPALAAVLQVLFELQSPNKIQLAVKVSVQPLPCLMATHFFACQAEAHSRVCSSFRARDSRDITVPNGAPTI